MSEEKVVRDFKGIWIPKEIWLDKNLTTNERLLFVEIDSLDNEKGCWASNNYFSDFFDLSKTRVSEIINSLVKKEYITSTMIYKEGGKEIDKRILKVNLPHSEKCNTPIRKSVIPHSEKCNDNNTIINNINNNKNNTEPKVPNISTNKLFSMKTNNVNSKETLDILVKSIVDHMNMRLGKHLSYKSNTKVIENLVNKDNTVTLDKIKLVIDWKIYDWYNSYDPKSTFDGTKYLTFDTLLRPANFNKYISEMEVEFKYPENWNSEHLINIKNSSKSRDGLYVEHNQKEADKVNDKNINKYMH